MEKLWTTAEVAQCLGLQEPEVEQLVRQGTLTGYKLGGQFLRFRPDQVEALKREMRAGTLQVESSTGRTTSRPPAESRWSRMRDTLYFYDFYLASAALLMIVTLYLLMSTG
ncbi:MAG: helix-turn-helix domain-containing protein [Candidatus Omnitrophota bacterium]|nr:helix-turn-helix domain-containing protein [Candidatus Omnitrophota bacterium]